MRTAFSRPSKAVQIVRPARAAVRKDAAGLNRVEARYQAHLEVRRLAGEVAGYWFAEQPGGIKLRIGGACFWSPDFLVQLADGTLELHEVKGHWEDDARVKIKAVAAITPMRVIAVTWSKSAGWITEEFI